MHPVTSVQPTFCAPRGIGRQAIQAQPSILAIRFSSAPPLPDTLPMTRSYVRVIVVWIVTLLALYAFQEYFS
ncbi:MAG: hypothetical protein WBC51_22845 [Vicinamibacterales bacterium]